ncbi:UNVERIFIED_ORG: hypothetical protein [Escherichia phage CMSTMSU]
MTKITLVKETEQFLLEALVHEWCKRNNTFDIPEDQRTKIAEQAKNFIRNVNTISRTHMLLKTNSITGTVKEIDKICHFT